MIAIELLIRDVVKQMKSKYVYGVTRRVENNCDVTSSRAYQVYWSRDHLDTFGIFLELVAPVYEHDFELFKFTDDEEDEKDVEIKKCVQKTDGEWHVVDYRDDKCEYCDTYRYDISQYRKDLEELLAEAASRDVMTKEKIYMMYRRFTRMKYGSMGTENRRKLCGCVQELIIEHFPVEKVERKRRYEER